MSEQQKTHYRKVFKSDHLGCADLEDFIEAGNGDLIFTINYVRQEQNAKVAGKKINANIAYFNEKIKPLVLNATNSKVLKGLTGSPFVEDWAGTSIQLYIDPTAKLKGEVVGGVRVSPNPVRKVKPVLTRANATKWAQAVTAFKRDGNLSAVLSRMDMSQEDMQAIADEANSNV